MLDKLALLGFGDGGWGLALLQGAAITISIALATVPFGLALGLDQDDGVGHRTVWVSPGASTTTLVSVAFSTSLLNACASVSIGGNVS